ncbi:MAG TPA: VWA domain-containing protein [Planctomycetota bacterium]
MPAFLYEQWDEELLARLRSHRDLLQLFQELLLRANGDVERALRYMEQLRRSGRLGDADIEAFQRALREKGVIDDAKGFLTLTGKGERMLRQEALSRVFSDLKRGPGGEHRTSRSGDGGERLPETRPWRFGEDVGALDVPVTLRNALVRTGTELRIGEADLEVSETEHHAICATVLLLDVSHSMILYGEDRITPAKRVALAMAEMIRTRYPKDSLQVCLFGDAAEEVPVERLPYVGAGPYHTNTAAALRLAQRLLLKKKHPNRRIFMVTDGKPSAIFENGKLYKNPFALDPKITAKTLEEAASCRRNRIPITTFMLTQDPTLVDFVDTLTRVNRGKAYYASPDDLGNSVFVDYLRNRKRRLGN